VVILEFCAANLQVELKLNKFVVPIIHQVKKKVVREAVKMGINKVYPLVHLVAVAKHV
jgi:hypothetical protein